MDFPAAVMPQDNSQRNLIAPSVNLMTTPGTYTARWLPEGSKLLSAPKLNLEYIQYCTVLHCAVVSTCSVGSEILSAPKLRSWVLTVQDCSAISAKLARKSTQSWFFAFAIHADSIYGLHRGGHCGGSFRLWRWRWN